MPCALAPGSWSSQSAATGWIESRLLPLISLLTLAAFQKLQRLARLATDHPCGFFRPGRLIYVYRIVVFITNRNDWISGFQQAPLRFNDRADDGYPGNEDESVSAPCAHADACA